MLTAGVQAVLFVSSFSPLLLVFALLDTFGKGAPSIICIVLAVASSTALAGLLALAPKLSVLVEQAEGASKRDSDTIAYVVTYLVPFAGLAGSTGREQAAIGLFLAVLAVLYVRTELFFVNPLLSMAGFRLYRVTLASGREITVITKSKFIGLHQPLRLLTLTNDVYMEASA